MIRQKLIPLMACVFVAVPPACQAANDNQVATAAGGPSNTGSEWPVAGSLRGTIAGWARRQGWPAPQFLTDADWPVDVPGSITGSIEHALTVLAAGFGDAAVHPRIEISANHVIVVSETGADR